MIINALYIAIAVSFLGFFALRSSRIAWIVYVIAMGCSGLEIPIGPIHILPEHLVLPVIAWHVIKSQSTDARRLIPLGRPALFASFVLVFTWLILATVVSAAYSPDFPQSMKMIVWVAVNFGALVLVGFWKVNRHTLLSDGLLTATAVVALSLVAWLYANASGTLSIFVEDDYASETLRASGLMLEPNLLASYCALWICVAFVNRRRIPRAVAALSVALLACGILATYTRAAILVLGIVAVAWMIQRRNFVVLTFIGLFSIFAILATGVQPLGDSNDRSGIGDAMLMRLATMLDSDSGTGAFRVGSWELAWSEIQASGFLHGHGFNSFSQLHESDITSTGELYLGFLWLSLWYDSGLLGALLFVVAFGLYWISAGKTSWPYFVAFAVVSVTTSPLWYAYPWVLAILVFNGTSGLSRAKNYTQEIEHPRSLFRAEYRI